MQRRRYSNKKMKLFILFVTLGIFIGFIYFYNIKPSDLKIILDNIKNNNLIILNNKEDITNHLKIISIVIALNFVYLGFFIFIGLLISEGFKFAVKSLFLYKIYKVKGLIYYFIHFTINYFIYFIFLYMIFKKIFKITYLFYKKHIKKETINYFEIINQTRSMIYYLIIILINDFIIYLNYEKIAKLFAFLLK